MSNLTFSTGASQATVKLKTVGTPFANSFTANGQPYTLNTEITIQENSSVTFAGTTNNLSKNGSSYYQFETSGGDLTVSGDLVSLIANFSVKMYSFFNLFKDCTNITNISQLVFPTTIADWCYANMFMDCTGLVNAGTTLPATVTSRWCYEGMFARCTNLTTPPNILATKLAPFCYMGMFTGCTSLVEAPSLPNKKVEGDYSTNIMFKGCSNLSTIQVSFTDWPSGGTWSRKWLDGVAENGLFVYPNTLPVSAIEATSTVPDSWTLSSTYPSIINIASETFSYDAMSDTEQLKELAYTYNNPEGTVTITPDLTNKPNWLSCSTDSNSINFSANGYAINTSASFDIPIQLSADDAAPKSVTASFNITNYPLYTIELTTIPTFTFDKLSETNIVSSLLSYATYGGSSLSCEIEGELPTGLSCVDGIITGIPSQFDNNFGPEGFSLIYSAQDARTVTSSVSIEIINAVEVMSAIPVTFEAISGNTYVVCERNGRAAYSDNSFYYRRVDTNGTDYGWQAYTLGSQITLNMGDKVSFSGTTSEFGKSGQSCPFNFYGGNKMKVYGNIHSLVNYAPLNSHDYLFRNLFRGDSNQNNKATGIEDCSELWLPVPQDFGGTYSVNAIYSSAFRSNGDIKYLPRLRITNWNLYSGGTLNAFGFNSTKICYIEVDWESWNMDSNQISYFLFTTSQNGVYIKPKNLSRDTRGYYTNNGKIPDSWTIINKEGGKTYICNSDNSNGAEVIVSNHGQITYV